jgi:tRNA1Val (adenine37-N6)-methyltransferase
MKGLLLPDLLKVIKKNLEPDGVFFLLLPFKRNEEIKKLIIEHEFFIHQMLFVKQSVNRDHFRIMLAGKLNRGEKC